MPISNEAIQSERTVRAGASESTFHSYVLFIFQNDGQEKKILSGLISSYIWVLVLKRLCASLIWSSGPLYSFQSHRVGAGCHYRVHLWMRRYLIAGFYVSNGGFSAMLKATLVVLWGCPGTSTPTWTIPMFCPNQGWNWEPSASQLRALQIVAPNDSFKYKI